MYATPSIKTVAMTTEASSCCHFYVYSQDAALKPIANPACGPVIQQFPTCGVITNVVAPSLCVISVQTPVATVVASGH
jgi:hypothetical protein